MSTPRPTSADATAARLPIRGTTETTSRRRQDHRLRIVHHALGVKLAAELGEVDRALEELDALLDTLAVVEAALHARRTPGTRNRKALT